jgi:hypothetical protein
MEQISDDVRWYRLFLRKTELEITRIFRAYREIGVDPVLIKGWAAARNYPKDKPRFFSDIDIAIPSYDYHRCLEWNRSDQRTTLNIDLHREFRHLDTAPWPELFARSELVELDQTKVRLLCPEDHLRILSTHWLTDGGQYKLRLWDIYYAVENRPKDFDWSLCLETVSPTRRKWIVTTIAIARKHLGLDVSSLPFADETENIPPWVEKCLAQEWSTDVRLRPLETCLNDRKTLLRQIRKRVPPNPIQATVEAEGGFDDGWRLVYQARSIAKRVGPSVLRVAGTLANKLWKAKNL